MRPTTLRFPESLWRLIVQEARREGISTSAFIRESVLAVILLRRASRDPQIALNWERARQEIRELLDEADLPE